MHILSGYIMETKTVSENGVQAIILNGVGCISQKHVTINYNSYFWMLLFFFFPSLQQLMVDFCCNIAWATCSCMSCF